MFPKPTNRNALTQSGRLLALQREYCTVSHVIDLSRVSMMEYVMLQDTKRLCRVETPLYVFSVTAVHVVMAVFGVLSLVQYFRGPVRQACNELPRDKCLLSVWSPLLSDVPRVLLSLAVAGMLLKLLTKLNFLSFSRTRCVYMRSSHPLAELSITPDITGNIHLHRRRAGQPLGSYR
jgi:hypothetical protein